MNGAPVANPTTIATAIRIGNPASWTLAEEARDSSGGLIDAVTDKQILEAYRLVARSEAVFVGGGCRTAPNLSAVVARCTGRRPWPDGSTPSPEPATVGLMAALGLGIDIRTSEGTRAPHAPVDARARRAADRAS